MADDTRDPFALDDDDVKEWRSRVDRALQKQKEYHPWWEAALKTYAPSPTERPNDYRSNIRTNRAFTIVERKEADLFYQRPDVTVTASPLLQSMDQGGAMSATHSVILNEKLGLDGIDARALARSAIFDYELFAAGWTKIGYRSYTVQVEQELPVLGPQGERIADPETGLEAVEAQMVDVPIKKVWFWESFSPKQAVIPSDWFSTDFDKAPWLGMKFEIPLKDARAVWGEKIPEDFTPSSKQDDSRQRFDHGAQGDAVRQPTVDTVTGTELYYKSSLFRDDRPHPDHLTKLVLIDGIPEPVEHVDSPEQTIDPQTGKLTPDSLIGYPYHPLIVRTLTDSAYVMSDVAIALPLVQELDKFREQGVRQRDINLTRWVYNTDDVPEPDIAKITMTGQGGMIGLPAESFGNARGPIQPLPMSNIPPENFVTADRLDNDLSRTFAIDSASAGASRGGGSGDLTATEANLRQANANVRLGWEQNAVADWYIQGVTKFSTLIQRYMTAEDAAEIVGPEPAKVWAQFVKAIPTRLAFTMLPDSSLRNDTPLDRKQHQDLMTYGANDPNIDRRYMWEQLLSKYHLDPEKALVDPSQLPEPKPEPPNLSFSIKGEDLNPMSPQSPIVLDILEKVGVDVDPEAIKMAFSVAAALPPEPAAGSETGKSPTPAQPPHGGKAVPLESLDKHQADQTFATQSTGVPSPGGPARPIS